MAFSGSSELRRTLNASVQIGVSLGSGRQLINEANGDGETKKVTGTAAIGGALDYSVSSTRIDFIDVNGDGLIDHVAEDPGAGNKLRVRLNLGYGFSKEMAWTFPAPWSVGTSSGAVSIAGITLANLQSAMTLVPGSPDSTNAVRLQDTGTNSLNLGGSVGVISGGGGPTFSVTRKWVDLIDVNGDGLPDQVLKVPGDASQSLRVRLNTGTGFAAEQSWALPNWSVATGGDYSFLAPDGLGFSTIDGWNKSFSFLFCFIGCIGMSGFDTNSHGGPSADFEDIDGDGKVDQVLKVPGDPNVYAKLNNLGQANLLSVVSRPLGGPFIIHYTRAGNHVDLTGSSLVNMPSNQWVMSGVWLDSEGGLDSRDCQDHRITENFTYSNSTGQPAGYFDRVERENLGYSDVRTIYPCEDTGGTAHARTYNNQNYYLRGLEANENWYQNNATGPSLRSGSKTYADPSRKDPTAQPPHTGTFFPSPLATVSKEIGTVGEVTQLYLQYFDTSGNLTDVYNEDIYDPSGNLHEHIVYQHPSPNITVPLSITTRTGTDGNGGTLLRKRMATYFPEGKPQTITDVIVGGKNPDTTGTARTEANPANATWAFTYDALGNVKTATSPGRRTLQYGYDPTAQTYPMSTTQVDPSPSFRYAASANYDLRFGVPTRIVDEAGARQETDYDNYGRVTAVFAPSDFDASGNRINPTAPTIGVTYSQGAHTNGLPEATVPAYAVATHRTTAPPEGSLPGAVPTQIRALRTVNFVDGLGRSIETKKDITRDDGTGTRTDGMSVSGKVTFDSRGRVYQQGQPAFALVDPLTLDPTHFEQVGMLNPTQYAYDVFGRLRQEQHSDGGTQAITSISYDTGLPPDGEGVPYITKTTTDPLYANDNTYHFRTEYISILGHVRLLFYRNQIADPRSGTGPRDLQTLYSHDPLGQVLAVTDAAGNATTAAYDTVGNLVTLTSPDSGRREWRYCVGGYVCAEESPNSRAANKLIQYTYDRDRLTTITYPSDHNVTFTYGAPNDAGNTAGRLKHRVDEAGTFDYTYDSFGNVNNETAVLNSQMGGAAQPYTTKYLWDNFGRLIDVTVPGATPGATTETIRYGYDAGGTVASAIGKMGSTTNSYVNHVGYDEFGSRVRLNYGNGAVSTYTYAPDTRRLAETRTMISPGPFAPQPLQSLVYSYDLVGNVKTRNQFLPADDSPFDVVPFGGGNFMSYSYDQINQLTHVDMNSREVLSQQHRGSYDVAFDLIGNITSKTQTNDFDNLDQNSHVLNTVSSGYSFTATYGATAFNSGAHAPIAINGGPSAVNGYDPDGNLVSSQSGGSGQIFAWTDTDRLRSICAGSSAQSCGPATAQALYDANGVRTSNKVSIAGTSETLYVNQYLTVRNASTGPLPTKHVYVGDMRVASKLDNTNGSSSTYWYHSDNLQSAELVTTTGQAVVQHVEYFPSGEIWYEVDDSSKLASAVAHETTFTGKELDPSGFYYFGARYYDPRVQMWLSPDPILGQYMRGQPNGGVFQPRNLGLYTYAGNNPVVMKDPDGKVFWLIAAAAAALSILNSEGDVEPPKGGGEVGVRPTPLLETGVKAGSYALLFLTFREGAKSNSRPGPWRAETPPEPPPQQADPAPAEQSGPTQAYSRREHYGSKTPSQADRKALGAGPDQVVDHDPPLVKRYYDGDPAVGEKPGKQMTGDERRASANDRTRMKLQSKTDSNRQGWEMKNYSQSKRGDH